MKILAIRGKNLASIAGEFEIDFTREPLRSAGIFAICGATGAGKSTILDALCLALFNNTPRTTGTESIKLQDVGKEQISQGDKRQILRRGTTDGYAEVDFLAIDGKIYRSHWHIRRAGNRITGKLQPVDWRVYEQGTQSEIASRITESENKLKELTGLTYEQFTRTVLLAQNEFARFLKARKDEKAEVLEKLTGTEIYSVISNTVYVKSAEAKAAWKQTAGQLSDIHLLTEGELTVFNEKLKNLQDEEATIRQEQSVILRKLEWFSRYAGLQREISEAQIIFQEARQAVEANRPQEEFLKQIESIESASPIWHNRRKYAHDLTEQKTRLTEKSAEFATAEEQAVQTTLAYDQCKKILEACTEAYNTLQPELKKARETDVRIKSAEEQLSDCMKKQSLAIQNREKQETLLAEKQNRIQALKEQTAALDNWFEKSRKHEPMFSQTNLISDYLASALKAIEENKETEKSVQLLTVELEKISSRQKDIISLQNKAEAALNEKSKEKDSILKKSESLNIVKLRNDRKELQSQKDELQEYFNYSQKLIDYQVEINKKESLCGQFRHSCENLQEKSSEYTLKISEGLIRQETSQQLYEKAQQAANSSISGLRLQLIPGTPCPVCGSCDHPAADTHAEKEPALHLLKSECEKYESLYRQLSEEKIRIEQDLLHTRESLRISETELSGMRSVCEEILIKLNSLSSHTGAPAKPNPENQEQVRRQLSIITGELQSIEKQESDYEIYNQQIQEISDEIGHFQLEQNRLNELIRTSKEEEHRITANLLKEKTVSDKLKQQVSEILEKLNDKITIDNWQARWEIQPVLFCRELSEATEKWQSRQQEYERIQKAITQLQAEINEGTHTLENLRLNEEETLLACRRQTTVWERLKSERQQLLQGKNADETELVHRQRIQEHTGKLEQSRKNMEEKNATRQKLQGEIGQLQQNTGILEEQYNRYSKLLSDWLASYNLTAKLPLTDTTLSALIEVEPEEIKKRRDQVNLLYQQYTVAQATLSERETQLSRHLQLPDKPDNENESSEKLNLCLEVTKQKLEAINQDKTEIAIALRTHEQCCTQAGELRQKLELQTGIMEQWGKLDDLIGSQSGYKFKEIAQGYTLDILLGYANKQLKELSPRYQLQRVENELALQIIDHDMCDEIRSVYSLSGGESFLISLALALGLSAFASHNHHEENLFIDEGFGSLDAKTLQIAMDALERLRIQGRKVGVISHISEMAERIPVQILVEKAGNGKSKVKIIS